MNTRTILAGLLGSCLLLLSSCLREKEPLVPELSLSVPDLLEVQSEKSETIITVKTNMPQWAAVSNAPWLSVIKLANNLVLNAESNTTGSPREAQVLVISGGSGRTLKVVQVAGGTLAFELLPSDCSISKDGGELRLIAQTPLEDWSATTASDWLQVIALPRQGLLLLKAEANPESAHREAEIKIMSGSLSKSIMITQHGQSNYAEPFNLFGKDLEDVDKLERVRGSKLIRSAEAPSYEDPYGTPDYTYKVAFSPLFESIRYEFVNYGSETLYCTTLVGKAGSESLTKRADLLAWLSERGYTKSNRPSTPRVLVFENTGTRTELHILIKKVEDEKNPQNILIQDLFVFRPLAAQPAPMQTLKELMLGPDGAPGTLTVGEVTAWEAQNGGHYDKEFSENYVENPFFFAEAPFYGRLYFRETDEVGDLVGYDDEEETDKDVKVVEYRYFYLDYKVGFYSYAGMYYPTREFEDLLKKNGFSPTFYNPESRDYYYTNQEKGIRLACEVRKFARRYMLSMSIYAPKPPKPSPTGMTPMRADRDHGIFSPISKRK